MLRRQQKRRCRGADDGRAGKHSMASTYRSRPLLVNVRGASRSPPDDGVDGRGEGDVALAQAARIMGAERDIDAVVDIEPFGMVILLLGEERDPAHEAEGGVEIGEFEAL